MPNPAVQGDAFNKKKKKEKRELANWIKQELKTNRSDNP